MSITDLRALAAYHREQSTNHRETAERMIGTIRERNYAQAEFHANAAHHLEALADAFAHLFTIVSHEN